MDLRIRDFFRVGDKIFSVVEYSRKKEVKSLLRYIRDNEGIRRFKGNRYRKLSFEESFKELKNTNFLKKIGNRTLQVVNKKEIDEVFRPEKPLRIDEETEELFDLFSEYIPRERLGVTGSRLLNLEKPTSDIDFVVYGLNNFKKARIKLKEHIESGRLGNLEEKDWKKSYRKRDPPFSYKTYLSHSERKLNKAKINGTKFDLLFVRSSEEEWPKRRGITELGDLTKIETDVISDKYCFDMPAVYELNHEKYNKVYCFSHTYVGQVFEGEKAVIKGKEIIGDQALLVGTSRSPRNEFVLSSSLDFFSFNPV